MFFALLQAAEAAEAHVRINENFPRKGGAVPERRAGGVSTGESVSGIWGGTPVFEAFVCVREAGGGGGGFGFCMWRKLCGDTSAE